jgi:hypothetical protein
MIYIIPNKKPWENNGFVHKYQYLKFLLILASLWGDEACEKELEKAWLERYSKLNSTNFDQNAISLFISLPIVTDILIDGDKS